MTNPMWPIWEEEKWATDQSWFPAQPVALAPVQPVDVDQAGNVNCVNVGSVINSVSSTMYEQTCYFYFFNQTYQSCERKRRFTTKAMISIRPTVTNTRSFSRWLKNSVFPTCIVGTHIFEEKKKDNGWQLHLPSMMALFSCSAFFTWSLSFSSTSLWGVLCRRAAFCLSRARTCVIRNEQSFWAFAETLGNFWAFAETPGNSWKLLETLAAAGNLPFLEVLQAGPGPGLGRGRCRRCRWAARSWSSSSTSRSSLLLLITASERSH